MTIETFRRDHEQTMSRILMVWLCRLAGFAMFGLGLWCWIRLVGIYDGALWRFDLMPIEWRIVAPILAVLYPIAGVGLWMTVSWGAVVWVIVAMIEAAACFSDAVLVGPAGIVLIAHAVGLAILAALKLLAALEARRRRP